MQWQKQGILALSLVTIASATLLYFRRESILDGIDLLVSSPERVIILKHLWRIQNGLQLIEESLTSLKNSSVPNDQDSKKELFELSADVDFVLSELDQIRGDQAIKMKRKELVSKANESASFIEVLLNKIKS